MTAELWFFDTNVVVYLFDEKSPKKTTLSDRLGRNGLPAALHYGPTFIEAHHLGVAVFRRWCSTLKTADYDRAAARHDF
jgi:predicted nucleic acid-binding protein